MSLENLNANEEMIDDEEYGINAVEGIGSSLGQEAQRIFELQRQQHQSELQALGAEVAASTANSVASSVEAQLNKKWQAILAAEQSKLGGQIKTLSASLAKANKNIVAYQALVKKEQDKQITISKTAADYKTKFDATQKALATRDATIKDLTNKLNTIVKEKGQTTSSLNTKIEQEKKVRDAKIASLTAEIAKYKNQANTAIATRDKTIADLKSRFETASRAATQYQQQAQKATGVVTSEVKKRDNAIAQLKQQVKAGTGNSTAVVVQLQKQMAQLKTSANSTITNLKGQLASLNARYVSDTNALKQKVNALTNQLVSVSRNAQVNAQRMVDSKVVQRPVAKGVPSFMYNEKQNMDDEDFEYDYTYDVGPRQYTEELFDENEKSIRPTSQMVSTQVKNVPAKQDVDESDFDYDPYTTSSFTEEVYGL